MSAIPLLNINLYRLWLNHPSKIHLIILTRAFESEYFDSADNLINLGGKSCSAASVGVLAGYAPTKG